MAAPVASKIILPDDTSNTGKKVRTQTRVVGADTVHVIATYADTTKDKTFIVGMQVYEAI